MLGPCDVLVFEVFVLDPFTWILVLIGVPRGLVDVLPMELDEVPNGLNGMPKGCVIDCVIDYVLRDVM